VGERYTVFIFLFQAVVSSPNLNFYDVREYSLKVLQDWIDSSGRVKSNRARRFLEMTQSA
jgi:hypothetical protein